MTLARCVLHVLRCRVHCILRVVLLACKVRARLRLVRVDRPRAPAHLVPARRSRHDGDPRVPTSAPGPGSPQRPVHICTGTGLSLAHICTGNGLSPRPHLRRDWALPRPQLHRDRAHPRPYLHRRTLPSCDAALWSRYGDSRVPQSHAPTDNMCCVLHTVCCLLDVARCSLHPCCMLRAVYKCVARHVAATVCAACCRCRYLEPCRCMRLYCRCMRLYCRCMRLYCRCMRLNCRCMLPLQVPRARAHGRRPDRAAAPADLDVRACAGRAVGAPTRVLSAVACGCAVVACGCAVVACGCAVVATLLRQLRRA
jgi:hypothetical protein